MKEELLKKMQALNEQIMNKQLNILTVSSKISEGLETLSIHEHLLKGKIASEVDENNKKVYTNDALRQARFDELINKDEMLLTLKKQLSDDKLNLEREKIVISNLKKQFVIYELTLRE